MRRTANLSILGLYLNDNTIFDGLQLPDGLDRETLVNNLVAELADFELVYPSGDFMKKFIPVWSAKNCPVWEKLYKTTQFEYDPISNYHRKEEWEDTAENRGSRKSTSNGSSTNSSTTKKAGYNSETLVTESGDESTNSGIGESTNESESETTGKHIGEMSGNIGITSTQRLIEEERRVAVFNIYAAIIESFKMRFCILVY